MVVKSQIKFIKSLQQKKYRAQNGLFVAEGTRMVQDLLKSDFNPFGIYTTAIETLGMGIDQVELVSEETLRKISGLVTPNKVVAVFKIPKTKAVDFKDWVVALDDVRDPGNLGTIIRLCDWFGIKHLICSKNTVDCYNPKVLQATMGSIARVNVVYEELSTLLKAQDVPVYGAFMDGANVYKDVIPNKGIIVMGNEANGISREVAAMVNKKISIPQFGNQTAESLNVATATSILLSEIRRKAS